MLLSKDKIEELIKEYYEMYYEVEDLEVKVEEDITVKVMYKEKIWDEKVTKMDTIKGVELEKIITEFFKELGYKIMEIDFYDTKELQKTHNDAYLKLTLSQIPKKRNKINYLKYEKALFVVDMVNGFVKEGILHDESIGKVIPRQQELIKENIANKNLTIFIKDAHEENSVEHQRFGGTPHCIRGTKESELVEELKEFEREDNVVSIEKNSTSFMEAEKLRELLHRLHLLKEAHIIGCCSDICVANGAIGLANYFDERNKEVKIFVHEDAIETFETPMHNKEEYTNAAKLLMAQQGIKLVRKGKKTNGN